MSKPKEIKVIHYQTIMLLSLAASLFLVIIFFAFYSNTVAGNRDQVIDRLIAFSQLTAEQVEGDKHQQLMEQNVRDPWLYGELVKPLLSLQQKFPEIIQVYTLVQTDQQDVWRIILEGSPVEQFGENTLLLDSSPFPKIHLAKHGTVVISDGLDKKGGLPITAYTPVYNSQGEVTAVLSLVMAIDDLILQEAKLFRNGLFVLGITILGVVIGSILITGKLLRPLATITKELETIKTDNKSLRLSENFPGEWSFLAKNFNQLLDDNHTYQKEQEEQLVKAIEEKGKIFQVYRDVIYAVTQGRVFLVTQEEFYQKICEDLPLISYKLEYKNDITYCRREIDSFLTDKCDWWTGSKRKQALLCLSEALTNVIKHAESGEVLVALADRRIVFYILDQGPGMSLEKLPYMVFINGFTTKNSLGSGFSLMHNYMDKMAICTTEQGTFLALEADYAGLNAN